MAKVQEQDTNLFKLLDSHIRPRLKYLEIKKPKIIFLISGPPSSGKTTLAKLIEEEFQAVRLSRDDARRVLNELHPDLENAHKERIVHEYIDRLKRDIALHSKNKMIVMDSSIDRTYENEFNFVRNNHYKSIVLALDIPIETHKKRIENRQEWSVNDKQLYLKLLDTRRNEQKEFLENHTLDIIVLHNYNKSWLIDLLKSNLDSKVS